MTNCEKCFDTGIYNKPNGKDDFDKEYCECPTGKDIKGLTEKAMEESESEDNEDLKHDKDCLCDNCMTEGDRLHDEEDDNKLQDELK